MFSHNKSDKLHHHGFFSSFRNTLVDIFSDAGILVMLVIAPIIYGFFYPWPYNSEVVQQVPVAIIDYDHSQLSETLIRYSDANPKLDIQVLSNENLAKEALWKQKISGYMIIPQGLEKKVVSGKLAQVSVSGNAGYFLLNKNIILGFSQAVGTVSAGIEIQKNILKGKFITNAKTSSQQITLSTTPLFNPTEGYGAYVVPGVSMLIIQQILLMSASMLVGTWFENNRHHASISGWLGRIMGLAFLSFLTGCFYYGWIFPYHNYTSGQNLLGSLLFLSIYCPTVAILGCLLGMILRQRERSLQLLIFSSLPIFFLSGFPWPLNMIPEPLRYFRLLFPSSSGIHTSLQLNQMGASISQITSGLYHLLSLAIIYFVLLIIFAYYYFQQTKNQPSSEGIPIEL